MGIVRVPPEPYGALAVCLGYASLADCDTSPQTSRISLAVTSILASEIHSATCSSVVSGLSLR